MKFLIFNIKQTLVIGGVAHTIWFPPDYGEVPLAYRAGLRKRTNFEDGQFYHKGDEVVKLRVSAGDHLFVDRLTYNFRKPGRGEIVVFQTKGIEPDFVDLRDEVESNLKLGLLPRLEIQHKSATTGIW